MSTAPLVPVGELMVSRGGSVNPLNFPDEDFDLYSIPAFDAGKPEVTVGADIGSTKQVVQPNDVLLSKIVPHIRRAWVVGADRGRRLIGSGEWIVFRSKRVWPDYLRHVLVGDPFHQQFMQTVSGVGGSLLRARPAFVAGISIPLPPLEEQRRIAAILDQAETLRTQRRAALAQLDSLTQSIFLDMFGDPVTNSKGWPITQIGHEVKLQGGFAFKSSDYVANGIKLVKISNVHRDALTWDDIDQLPDSYLEIYKSFNLNLGDIVIALTRPIIQSLDSVKIAVVSSIDIPSLLNQRVGRFIFKKTTRLDPQYLLGFCRSKAFFHSVKKFCSESLQPNMSTSQVEELAIPLPPLALQQTFATRIQAIESLKTTHRTALTELDALFASLQQRAFAGEL